MKIEGGKFWLWRAVDQNGIVLDEILQRRRDKNAAKRLLHRLMKRQERAPKRFITDKLRSYGAAKREIAPCVEQRSHKGLNNRAENSHLPFRKRERAMPGFLSLLEVCGGLYQSIPRSEIASLSRPVVATS